jgi:hypothetical protein
MRKQGIYLMQVEREVQSICIPEKFNLWEQHERRRRLFHSWSTTFHDREGTAIELALACLYG